MPSYEHFNPEQFFPAAFDAETGLAESLPPHTMDFNWNAVPHANYNDHPFHFVDPVPTNMDVATEGMKYEMARTTSNGSMQRQSHESPPALYQSESIRSASSSTVSSPYSGNAQMAAMNENYQYSGAFIPTTIVSEDPTFVDYNIAEDYRLMGVDPNMLDAQEYMSNNLNVYSQLSHHSYTGSYSSPSPVPSNVSHSNFYQPAATETYFQARSQRGTSVLSHVSGPTSPRISLSGDEDNVEKDRCTWPECGRRVKDLKAHILTHQAERPEKCPIVNCPYHDKGFARKYDRNRHVLVHYKGSMVCGFCPGSGTSEEKVFNRADVFKRHLTKVHNVDKGAPNSKRRNPSNSNKKLSSYCSDATGKCSTCSVTFEDAQDFYNHLDECLFQVVAQVSDSERINEDRLAEVDDDPAVQETLARNGVTQENTSQQFGEDDADDFDNNEDDEEDDGCGKGMFKPTKLSANRAIMSGKISKSRPGKKGMTWSKGGVPLVCKGRKRRKHYPPSWGMSPDKMKMKKRVICAYDGSRRLLKDDIMLHNDHEVRMKVLDDESRWVTDLDIETLNRANAFLDATPEEKGTEEEVWIKEQEFHSMF